MTAVSTEKVLFTVAAVSFSIAVALRIYTAVRDRHRRKAVTATVPCDGGCGVEIRRNEKHITINRHIEYMDSDKSVTVIDAETVKSYHLDCEPLMRGTR